MASQFLELEPYTPPPWAAALTLRPAQRYRLGILPTPVHRFNAPGVPEGVELWMKRDDLSGMQLSGNKVRKLEFLLAEVMAQGHDCVVTLGGIQSNHCRATAVAARYLGLDCHLVLRTSRGLADEDPGLTGNLLVERLAGAHLHLITKEEYQAVGSVALGERLAAQLRAQGLNPYVIPVGGSSSLGTWGYIEAARETLAQAQPLGITDLAVACGSGGTTAGLALGLHLAESNMRVHSYGVCDDPEYFYSYCDELMAGLGATKDTVGVNARDMFSAVQAKGVGYAMSTEEELQAVQQVALHTGVILDPVYSGKALHKLLQDMRASPEEWQGRKVLFLHTGGLLGLYDKVAQLQPLMEQLGRCERMQVD